LLEVLQHIAGTEGLILKVAFAVIAIQKVWTIKAKREMQMSESLQQQQHLTLLCNNRQPS